jgi:hypothetical protein
MRRQAIGALRHAENRSAEVVPNGMTLASISWDDSQLKSMSGILESCQDMTHQNIIHGGPHIVTEAVPIGACVARQEGARTSQSFRNAIPSRKPTRGCPRFRAMTLLSPLAK